jgi:hypothetical protein
MALRCSGPPIMPVVLYTFAPFAPGCRDEVHVNPDTARSSLRAGGGAVGVGRLPIPGGQEQRKEQQRADLRQETCPPQWDHRQVVCPPRGQVPQSSSDRKGKPTAQRDLPRTIPWRRVARASVSGSSRGEADWSHQRVERSDDAPRARSGTCLTVRDQRRVPRATVSGSPRDEVPR